MSSSCFSENPTVREIFSHESIPNGIIHRTLPEHILLNYSLYIGIMDQITILLRLSLTDVRERLEE